MRQLSYNQTGGGFFVGHRYQKGNGFFGKIIKKAILPFLKYIGKQGVKTAVAIGEDAFRSTDDLKTIAKSRLKEAGLQAIDDGANRMKKFVQTGEGLKRKKAYPKVQAKKLKTSVKQEKQKQKKSSKSENNLKTSKSKRIVEVSKTSSNPRKAIKGRSRRKPYDFLKQNGITTRKSVSSSNKTNRD